MSFYDAIRVGASGAAADFEIERSLRYNPADITNLERTFGSASNRRTWTLSFWCKRCALGRTSDIFSPYRGGEGTQESRIYFQDTDKLRIYDSGGLSGYPIVSTAARFRDVGAWYHFVVAVDTTQSTASNRVKLYANGVLQELDDTTYGNQNQELGWNNNHIHRVGAYGYVAQGSLSSSNINDGYLAEVNFIDGQQLTPSSFGETNSDTGQWVPIDTSGLTFGTNGFRLNFSDNSGTTATTLGKDTSGNGNNFTPNNFSVSAGIGYDSMADTPTNNFPTLSLFDKSSDIVLYNGNLRYSFASRPNVRTVRATFTLPSSGKYYWEFCNEQASSNPGRISMGVVDITVAGQAYNTNPNSNGYIQYSYGGGLNINGSSIGVGASWYNTERAAIAVDCDTGKFWFGKVASNGSTTWYNSTAGTDGNPATGSNQTTTLTTPSNFMPFGGWNEGGNGSEFFSASINFGQQPFLGTEPTGYKKLNSANLPDPTILLPNKHFDTLLYTANGGTQNITGLNFNPDWVWGKSRSQAFYHDLYDTVRGDNLRVFSNDTNAEASGFLQFGVTGGFALSAGGNINDGTDSVVAWNWNAGDTDGKTYTVKVVSDSGNKYRFDDYGTSAVTLDLAEGGTYTFDQSDSSMSSHPMQLSTTANGTHGGGSAYSTGVTYELDGSTVTASAFISGFSSASSRKLIITVAASAPTLYYYCYYHSGMGGQANTNSTLGSSNFDGTIQSTAKVNASAGFSIVSYTGTGADGTVGHGLGVTPSVIILKNRDRSVEWIVKHKSATSGYILYLNLTGAADGATGSNNGIIADLSSSSNFSLTRTGNSGNYNNVGLNGEKVIAYCFSEVAGYSKFGSYTGNGNSDGTFVFTGFKPALIISKKSSGSDSWQLWDNKRDPDNLMHHRLFGNENSVESTSVNSASSQLDFYSNGFKWRGSSNDTNGSGDTYIYLAFAESPFKNARAR